MGQNLYIGEKDFGRHMLNTFPPIYLLEMVATSSEPTNLINFYSATHLEYPNESLALVDTSAQVALMDYTVFKYLQ